MVDGIAQNNDTDVSFDGLLSQVENDLKKSKKEAVKAKLKGMVTKRDEARKAVKLAEAEIAKYLEDVKSGIE